MMGFYERFFDQWHRVPTDDLSVPISQRVAGTNARIPPDVRSVLDVGCGRGAFLNWLPGTYWKVGVDIARGPLLQLVAHRIQASIDALPVASASFDLVTCFEVLEHVAHDIYPRALREIARVSRKYILVSVPNREHLGESLVWCPYCNCAFNPSWHVRYFDPPTLERLFDRYRMVECYPCGPIATYGSSRLAALLMLLMHRKPPRVATCPQCGYSVAATEAGVGADATSSRHESHWWHDTLTGAARRVLFRSRRPYWLLAAYVRTD